MVKLFIYLSIGAALTVAAALLAAAFVHPRSGAFATASSWNNGDSFSVSRRDGIGFTIIVVDRRRAAKRPWGPEQATGAPDSVAGLDDEAAWASMSADGGREWIELHFAAPVEATAVRVYENLNPGAIDEIRLYDADGIELHREPSPTTMPTTRSAMPSEYPIACDAAISAVRLEIDSDRVTGWNEIDAVGLVDVTREVVWAASATASSSYADRNTRNEKPESLLPEWSALWLPTDEFVTRQVSQETRVEVTTGWPLVALRGQSGDQKRNSNFPRRGQLPIELVPWQPIWPGFVVDSLVYASFSWLSVWMLTRPRRAMTEFMRLRRGLCLQCGYDIRFDFAGGCSECGWLREHSEDRSRRTPRG